MSKARIEPDGTIFQLRWVVTPAGVQLSYLKCASCHTRFIPDGSRVSGAPGNGDLSAGGIGAELGDRDLLQYFSGDTIIAANYKTFAVPWVKPDVHDSLKSMTSEEFGQLMGTIIPGTFPRVNGSPYYTTKIPDLTRIRNRKYLDHTATHRHRGSAM
jgi:hypothetical protein